MRRLKYLIAGLVVVLPILVLAAVVQAHSFRSGNNVTVAQNATLNQTLFASGLTLDVAGTVNGDVFCAGQNITVSGTVNGDVMCAGQSVSVTGTVNGNVRLAGQDVTINGQVSGNATVAGQSFTLDSRSKIGGDLSAVGSDITLNGPVGRDAAFGSGTVTINSSVGRDVKAAVSTLTLGSKANVSGNINYTSSKDLIRNSGAVVGGSITRSAPKQQEHVRPGSIVTFGWLSALYMFVSFLLIALVLVLLLPRVFYVPAEYARRHMGRTFLVGLVSSIVVPVVLIGLMFTVIGIPLALFAGLVWLVLVLLSGPFAAFLLGRLILHGVTNNPIWTMLLGGAILLILYFVPFLGVLTTLLTLWFGLGAILLRTTHLPRPNYNIGPN